MHAYISVYVSICIYIYILRFFYLHIPLQYVFSFYMCIYIYIYHNVQIGDTKLKLHLPRLHTPRGYVKPWVCAYINLCIYIYTHLLFDHISSSFCSSRSPKMLSISIFHQHFKSLTQSHQLDLASVANISQSLEGIFRAYRGLRLFKLGHQRDSKIYHIPYSDFSHEFCGQEF